MTGIRELDSAHKSKAVRYTSAIALAAELLPNYWFRTFVVAMDEKRRPEMERSLSFVIHLLINLLTHIHALRYPNLFRVIWIADGIYWWTI